MGRLDDEEDHEDELEVLVDSDEEASDDTLGEAHHHHHQQLMERKSNPELPVTVSMLELETESPEGGDSGKNPKLYLVGTAHFSVESQNDVRRTIGETQPDAVMVELCPSRISILSMDEETVLREAEKLSTQQIVQTIKQSGMVEGILHVLLLTMSASITRQLGMAPGSEFRAARDAAHGVPGCTIQLGDRPISITLQRALGSLSAFQKAKLGFCILQSRFQKITKEDVEKCKEQDMLEQMLSELAGEFPTLTRIFIDERDQYMAFTLRHLLYRAEQKRRARLAVEGGSGYSPAVLVGVVGLGHAKGIAAHWNRCDQIDIASLCTIPPPSPYRKPIVFAIRIGILSSVTYGVYRLVRRFVI